MSPAKLNIDKVFARIGELGSQQVRYCLLLAVMNLYAPQFMIQYTFVGHDVSFTCNLDDNATTLYNACPNGQFANCKNVVFVTNDTDSIVSMPKVCV